MFDLKKGVFSIFGVRISKDTSPEALTCLPEDLVSSKTSKRGNMYFKFQEPIPSEDVDMYLEVDFFVGQKAPEVNLYPAVPDNVKDTGHGEQAKYRLAACKRWLKEVIPEPAESEGPDSICYDFGEGYIYAATQESRDYGLIGGEIRVRFEG